MVGNLQALLALQTAFCAFSFQEMHVRTQISALVLWQASLYVYYALHSSTGPKVTGAFGSRGSTGLQHAYPKWLWHTRALSTPIRRCLNSRQRSATSSCDPVFQARPVMLRPGDHATMRPCDEAGQADTRTMSGALCRDEDHKDHTVPCHDMPCKQAPRLTMQAPTALPASASARTDWRRRGQSLNLLRTPTQPVEQPTFDTF